MLVVLESTTYPGTTEDVVRPILEEASGLTAGADFHLALLAGADRPGQRRVRHRATPPRSSAASRPPARRGASAFYGKFVRHRRRAPRGTREAETAKLLENTYRHVNIALVNEMAQFCHELGIDLWDVIRCASTKPFGFQAFYPGPGVGGHCIPIDPNYLSHSVRSQARLPVPVRGAGPGDQRRDAGVRGPARAEPAQRARQGRQRLRRCCCSASPTSPTSPTSASPRPSRWPGTSPARRARGLPRPARDALGRRAMPGRRAPTTWPPRSPSPTW